MSTVNILWKPEFRVYKRSTGELLVCQGNLLTSNGIDRLTSIISSTSPVENLNEDAVRVGVGDDDQPESSSDTDLSTGANQWYEPPSLVETVDNTVRYEVTFGAGVANFVWACWGFDIDDAPPASAGSTPEDLFNRKVFNFGEKDGDIWDVTMILRIVG